MTWLQILLIIYGAINIVGGVIGFTKGSGMSLIVGGTFGAAVIALTLMTKTRPSVFRVLGVLVLGLAGFWIYRMNEVAAEGKPTTIAVMNLALSLVVFVTMTAAHFAATAKTRRESASER